MPITTSSQMVQDRFDELFGVDHGRKESFRKRFKQFHTHVPHGGWTDHGPIKIAPAGEQAKLVNVVCRIDLEGPQEKVDQHLAELRQSLEKLVSEGEQIELFVEEGPRVNLDDNTIVYEAHGVILRTEIPPETD